MKMSSITAEFMPITFAGVLLIVATCTDLASHRIPNILSLGGAAAALALQMTLGNGLLSGITGWAVGLLLFLPLYLTGGMAAGDVKLMAAVGACLGPKITLAAAACSIIAGGIIAIGLITARGGLAPMAKRYALMFRTLSATRKIVYIPPEHGEAATQRFPFAIAILAGTAVGVWWSTDTFFGW